MALLMLTKDVTRFRFRDTGALVVVQSRFIWAMAKLVKPGEKNAITVTAALKAMNVTNTETHRRQWRHAADYWQEQGVAVGATVKGYFIIETEAERKRCASFKQVTADAILRRKNRIDNLPLGKTFPTQKF
jgi:hypothetical protein